MLQIEQITIVSMSKHVTMTITMMVAAVWQQHQGTDDGDGSGKDNVAVFCSKFLQKAI